MVGEAALALAASRSALSVRSKTASARPAMALLRLPLAFLAVLAPLQARRAQLQAPPMGWMSWQVREGRVQTI